jgi:type II secretory pathway component GspD/PulD (secretin)
MKIIRLALVLLLLASVAWAQKRPEEIKIVFSDTDIAQVLRAISIRTGASIVYSGKDKHPVTLNVTVTRVEDAVRSAASAAGLVYRKVGDVFVVAANDDMRQALSPYTESEYFPLEPGVAAKILPTVAESLPYATVRVVGNRMHVRALPFDLAEAHMLIKDLADYEAGQKAITDTIGIASGNAAEIAKAISAVYPGVVVTTTESSESRNGALILTGPQALVTGARELVRKLDVPSAGEGNRRVVYRLKELRYANAGTVREFVAKAVTGIEVYIAPENFAPPRARFTPLGQMITSQNSSGGGAGGGGGMGMGGDQGFGGGQGDRGSDSAKPTENGNPAKSKVIVLKGSQALVDEAARLIDSVDTKPAQVRVEVSVVETSKTFSENLGLKYGFTPFQFFETAPGSLVTNPGINLERYNTTPIGIGQFSKTPLTFSATLNALIENGQAKVLATPSVQVIDNEDASVFIGNTIRARVAQAGALGAQTIEIMEFPIGILLLLHPRVNGDDNITMHVNPVVSTVTSVGADNIPQTSSREAETTVIVRDGETIVIGGLIRDEFAKTISEVPFLSKLPIIGELFKNRSTTKLRTEVMVMITPRIVRDGTEAKK